MTHVASRTRPSLFLRVTLKGGCGLGTRLVYSTVHYNEVPIATTCTSTMHALHTNTCILIVLGMTH